MADTHGRSDGIDDEAQEALEALRPRPAPARRRSLLTMRLTWRSAPVALLLIAGAIGLLRAFVVQSAIVDGRSMWPTLRPYEWVLVLKPFHPHRYSVAILTDPQTHDTVIKRVVGMPGDTLQVRPRERAGFDAEGGEVLVNGTPISEPYARSYAGDMYGPIQVPSDSYFVLGDNRDDSEDSRTYGPVKESAVLGIALAVVHPFSRMHLIPHTAEPARYANQAPDTGAEDQ